MKPSYDGEFLGRLNEAESFHFAFLSDTHTHWTPEPDQPSQVHLDIIEEINLLRPDFVISGGDLIRGYTTDEERLHLEHRGAKKTFGMLDMPFFPVIGNHDVREEISERVWREYWGARWYSFGWGDCHFVMLDSEIGKDWESIVDEQLDWLKADLEQHAVGKRLFVFLHRPYWYQRVLHKAEWKATSSRNDWNDVVDPILRQYDLRGVFVGHIHLFEHQIRDGVPHVVAGGAGGDIKRPREHGGVPHYVWVSVGKGTFTWSVIVPGQIIGRKRLDEMASGTEEIGADFTRITPWVPEVVPPE